MSQITLQQTNVISRNSLHFSRIKLFGLYIHSQFLLLLVLEILITAATVYAVGFYLDLGFKSFEFDSTTYLKIVSVPLVLSVSMAGVGLYNSRQSRNMLAIIVRFAVAVILSLLLVSALYTLFPLLMPSIQQYLLVLCASLIGLFFIRVCFYHLFNQVIFERRVLVIGTGNRAQRVMELLETDRSVAFDLVGFYRRDQDTEVQIDANLVVEGPVTLREMVAQHQVDEIVIALDDRRQCLPSDELLDCKLMGVSVIDLLDFYERESGKINLELLNPGWLIYANGFNKYFFSSFMKRSFDIICSLLLGLLTLPVFTLTALLIWLESKGKDPVFYQQERVGLNGRVFNVLKFRSMRTDAEKDGAAIWAQEHDPRVTVVGRIIRKYRIDELPQLLNILLGHMSLVGPRPERPEIVENLQAVNRYYGHRHRVKPGLTGWAQLRFKYGACEASAMEKLQYDFYYLKNFSILFDLCILIQTVEVVLFRKGAR